jgi:hypothetical protein
MSRIRLLLDEDTPILLAAALRERGYDAVHATEVGLKSRDDPGVMDHGIADGRAVITHNVRHYMPLVARLAQAGRTHHGLFLAPQLEFRDLLACTIHSLAEHEDAVLTNAVVWVT